MTRSRRAVGDKVEDIVGDKVGDIVGDKVEDKVEDKVGDKARSMSAKRREYSRKTFAEGRYLGKQLFRQKISRELISPEGNI